MNLDSDNYYENKYLKYKAKYLELKQIIGAGTGAGTGEKEVKELKVLTFNDPYCKGVNLGDVDDWFSIIFLAQKFKQNLHIVIVNSKDRKSKVDYLYMEAFLKITYGCKFYYDDDKDKDTKFLETEFDLCFICAPLPYYLFNYLKTEYRHKDTVFYLQGGENGYNGNSSINYPEGTSEKDKPSLSSDKFKWNNKIINLVTDVTNQSYKISDLRNYMENPICVNWNLYQVKKIFAVMPKSNLPYGFWYGSDTGDVWSGSGNTYNTMKIITDNIDDTTFKNYVKKNRSKFSTRLTSAYNSYIEEVCKEKASYEKSNNPQLIANAVKILKDPTTTTNEMSKAYEIHEKLRGSLTVSNDETLVRKQIDKLKKKYNDYVIPLIHYLIGNGNDVDDKIVTEVENLLIKADGSNKQIGEINNFEFSSKIITQTPKLFDFNMTAFIIDMYESKKEFNIQDEIIKYIAGQKEVNYVRNIKILNTVLEQFKSDLEKFKSLPLSTLDLVNLLNAN